MKRVIYLSIFLALIATLAGAGLGFANSITEPIIKANAAKAEAENLKKIFVNTTDFAAVDLNVDKDSPIVGIYEAKGSGYAYKVTVNGYKAPITFLIGIGNDAKFVGYEVLEIEDTAGIGTKVKEDDFIKTFVDKDVDTKIDTIGGATISSTAVVNGINAAVEHFNENFK